MGIARKIWVRISVVGVNTAERIKAPTTENFLFEIRKSASIIPAEESPPIKTGRLKRIPRENENRKMKFR